MSRRFLIIIFLSALLFECKAEIIFGSSEIKELYNRLPVNVRNVISQSAFKNKNGRSNTQIDWSGKTLSISTYNDVLIHIGIQLIGLSSPDKNDSTVISFLERELLRLSFDKSVPEMVNTAGTMQIRLFFQDNDLLFSPINDFDKFLSILKGSTSFKITKNNYLLIAEWMNGNENISMTFPNNYQLITGKNKPELDEELCKSLGGIIRSKNFPEESCKATSNDTLPLIVVKGSMFMDRLTSDIYYRLIGNDTALVFSENMISESVPNLFLNKGICGNRLLQLNNKLYGEKNFMLIINLRDFLNYFEDDFDCFVGMEKTSKEVIEGTVVFCHKYFNYINMLFFKTKSSEVFSNSGKIDADFYANIPMHNVSDLFKDHTPEDEIQKIDVNIKTP